MALTTSVTKELNLPVKLDYHMNLKRTCSKNLTTPSIFLFLSVQLVALVLLALRALRACIILLETPWIYSSKGTCLLEPLMCLTSVFHLFQKNQRKLLCVRETMIDRYFIFWHYDRKWAIVNGGNCTATEPTVLSSSAIQSATFCQGMQKLHWKQRASVF